MKKIIIAFLFTTTSLIVASGTGEKYRTFRFPADIIPHRCELIKNRMDELIYEHLVHGNYDSALIFANNIQALYDKLPAGNQENISSEMYTLYKWFLPLALYPEGSLPPAKPASDRDNINFICNADLSTNLIRILSHSHTTPINLPFTLYFPGPAYWIAENIFALRASRTRDVQQYDMQHLFLFTLHDRNIHCIHHDADSDMKLDIWYNTPNTYTLYPLNSETFETQIHPESRVEPLSYSVDMSLPDMIKLIINKHQNLFGKSTNHNALTKFCIDNAKILGTGAFALAALVFAYIKFH